MTLRQVFIWLMSSPLLGFCLGWSSNFVGFESGRIQSVELLQNIVPIVCHRCRWHWWRICGQYRWHQQLQRTWWQNLQPVSLIPEVHLDLKISPRIWEKIWNDPIFYFQGLGGRWFMKKSEAKISWHCPFKIIWKDGSTRQQTFVSDKIKRQKNISTTVWDQYLSFTTIPTPIISHYPLPLMWLWRSLQLR